MRILANNSQPHPFSNLIGNTTIRLANIVFLVLSLVLLGITAAHSADNELTDSYMEDFEKGGTDWRFWSEAPGGTKSITTTNAHSGKQALMGTSEKGIISLSRSMPNVSIKENTVISFWYYSTVSSRFDVNITAGIAKSINAARNKEENVVYTWQGKCIPNQWTQISIKAKDIAPSTFWYPKYKGSLVGDYAKEIQIAILPGKGTLIIDDFSISILP